jgi:tetraacyldisaccharide 4'-kinase
MGNRKYLILYPFSILYRLITDIRNLLYDSGILQSEKFRIPVICIGNITVGGTGKTPHTEYIISLLRKEFKVAFLSRGYKRKSKGFRMVTSSSTVLEAGDEPLQISGKFLDILVAIDKNRSKGIKTIIKEHPETNVVLLDDGFQHRSVKPGLSIVLTDYNRLITRDHLMPYGRLRENSNNKKRADIIIISKTPEDITEPAVVEITDELKTHAKQKLFFTKILYNDLLPLFENMASPKSIFSVSGNKGYGVVLITGIAVPDSLFLFLKKQFKEIIHLDFPDHHYFNEKDFEKIRTAWNNLISNEKILITTEKDAVRLKEFANIEDSLKKAFYTIPVKVSFLNDDNHEFENLILDYVRKNN